MAKGIKSMCRVLVVDDHPVVREGVRMFLQGQPGLEVVGEAEDGAAAISKLREVSADVVLLDLVMPRMNGLDALPGIRRARPKARVIAFTVHNTREYVQQALAAHVDGYLLKESSPEEYVEAIKAVMEGRFFVSPAAAEHLDDLDGMGTAQRFGLTPREYEYLALAARGDRPAQIARAMKIAEVTVRSFRKSVLKKLKIKNIAGLTRFAVEKGL
jgi:DNA-binding NarL/FixJ family response regulator